MTHDTNVSQYGDLTRFGRSWSTRPGRPQASGVVRPPGTCPGWAVWGDEVACDVAL
jgi:hypothetical protein